MKHFLFLFYFFSFTLCFAQQSKIDSLENLLMSANEDTSKINILNTLSRELRNTGDFQQSLQYANDALVLCKTSSRLSREVFMLQEKAKAYNNIGSVYWHQGDYPKALGNYFKALKMNEQLANSPDEVISQSGKNGMAANLGNIGIVYDLQDDYSKALDYYFKALKIAEELGNKKIIIASLGNIGLVYRNQGDYPKALDYYFKTLTMDEELGDKNGIAVDLGNIGIIYDNQGDYPQALDYYFKALRMAEKCGDKSVMAINIGNIGELYTIQKKYNEARIYLNNALQLDKEIGNKDGKKHRYSGLSILDSTLGNWKGAYEYHKLYSEMKDSLLNEESSKQIAEMQTKYETEKKEQQITLLNKDKELQSAELNRQKIIIWSVAGGLLVVLVLSIFIFRERKKSEKLLLNILPVETARELKRNGKAIPRHYESVTVMFTDFKGFTNIAEKLSAEELVSELDFLFKKFDEIISKYNIEKIKTIGDAYMCVSGLPTPNSNHAENIVMAGTEIQNWMIRQNNKPVVSGVEPWQLIMGIHSGSVTAGVVCDKKFAYDIWGDTVNIASRMESSGEAGQINISGATYLLIKDKFTCSFRGKIPAKNKGDIEMYFVQQS